MSDVSLTTNTTKVRSHSFRSLSKVERRNSTLSGTSHRSGRYSGPDVNSSALGGPASQLLSPDDSNQQRSSGSNVLFKSVSYSLETSPISPWTEIPTAPDPNALPYPGYLETTCYFLKQNSFPRNYCLRLFTNPYPLHSNTHYSSESLNNGCHISLSDLRPNCVCYHLRINMTLSQ